MSAFVTFLLEKYDYVIIWSSRWLRDDDLTCLLYVSYMSLICQPLGAVNPGLGAPRQVDGRTADGRPGRRCGADPPQTWTSGSQLLGAPWGQKNDGVEHPKSVSTLPRPKSCVFKEELYTKMWSRRTRDFLLIFGGIQAGAPDGSRWLQMAPGWLQMAPDDSRCPQRAPEGSRCLQDGSR